ncbi:MAG: kelch repeat-containing protein [Bacteroidota bacterium]
MKLIRCIYSIGLVLFLMSCKEDDAPKIRVDEVKPESGVVGDTLIVYGYFPGNPQVLIDNVPLSIVDQNEDSIRFKIPSSISAGVKSINVSNNDSDFGPIQFTLYPDLLSIDKSIITHNDEAIIIGTGFSPILDENKVCFNSQCITVLEASTTQLRVKVPTNIDVGEKVLIVSVSSLVGIVSSLASKSLIDVAVYGWQKITDHPRGVFNSIASFAIADNLYFLLSVNFSQTGFAHEVWRYNLTNNSWFQVKDFPGEQSRVETTSFSINEKGYVGLGYSYTLNHAVKDFWEYDPASDLWTQVSDFPGEARTGQCSFTLNGKGFIGTGISNGITSQKDFYSFDPLLNQWDQIADYPGGQIYGASSLTQNNDAYVIGGVINNDQPFNQAWKYNNNSGTWTRISDYPGVTSAGLASFGLNSFGYSGLGWINDNTPSQRIWAYDLLNDNWSEINAFIGSERFSFTYGTIGKYGYYGLGFRGNTAFSDLWVYLPKDFIP